MNRIKAIFYAVIAAFLSSLAVVTAQIGPPGGGGGGGTPCTTTANSLQYNNSGAFGCATEWVYTAAKKSLGDGANFQTYWDSSGVDLALRDAADSNFVVMRASAYKLPTGNSGINANTLQFETTNGVWMNSSSWRTSMQVLEFANNAGVSWSSSTTMDSGTYDTGFARNAAGVMEINSGTAGTFRDLEARGLISGGTIFANLPPTTAGTIAYITDGLAGNCGDSSCTTFGTTVTAGGGALKLLVWRNGTNWTLIGK